jgi:heme-degrading monooxygenase HmoA
MVITVFRNRLRDENVAEYQTWIGRISALAKTMPGYVSHKTFTADDGERVTIVEFESEEAQRGWAKNAEHVTAQRKGRSDFYSEYRIQVCNVVRDSAFRSPAAAAAAK